MATEPTKDRAWLLLLLLLLLWLLWRYWQSRKVVDTKAPASVDKVYPTPQPTTVQPVDAAPVDTTVDKAPVTGSSLTMEGTYGAGSADWSLARLGPDSIAKAKTYRYVIDMNTWTGSGYPPDFLYSVNGGSDLNLWDAYQAILAAGLDTTNVRAQVASALGIVG